MNRNETRLPFDIEIQVDATDIDEMGHVNNVVYLRWVQDAAVAHWTAAATTEEKRTLLWVVVKHEIEYKRQAFLGDTIIGRTWIGGASQRAFERHTDLLRKSDGKMLAKALTLWCPVDAVSKRRVEVSADVQARFSTGAD